LRVLERKRRREREILLEKNENARKPEVAACAQVQVVAADVFL